MHPYIQYQLTNIYVADMRSQAGRQRIVRTARRARRAPQRPAAQPVAGPGSVLYGLPALLTARGRRRQPGVLAAQAPQGLRA
jgi:hypothetical protein